MREATSELLGPELFAAFQGKGYATLTAVQSAVLDADCATRDLRITSQTGSGKTIAIGLVLAPLLRKPREAAPVTKGPKSARPRCLVITPTRELGRQVEEEITWLYEKLNVRVTAVTGGASYKDEHRALAKNPDVIVATPGRLIDHLEQRAIDPSQIEAVVLDEADRMLDMGFSESLEQILSKVPATRRTHLVSATFPAEVRHLADRIQSSPMHLEGTRLGAANVDIKHVMYLVDPHQRLDALINLLLAHAESRTLVFTRTRAGVTELEGALSDAGFRVAALSGEMAQRERTKALESFKRGALRILVATDVAARGIDVEDISLVLHMEPPTDADAYTHRSGRTGRAGRKGTSAVLVAPREMRRAHQVLARANVAFRLLPMPTPSSILAAQDARLVERLTTNEGGIEIDPRTESLAARLVEVVSSKDSEPDATVKMVARLLSETGLTQSPEPRDVRVILPEPERARPGQARFDGPPRFPRDNRFEPPRGRARNEGPAGFEGPREPRARTDDRAPITELPPAAHPSQSIPWMGGPSFPRPASIPRESMSRDSMSRDSMARDVPRQDREPRGPSGDFATFQVSWGAQHGADARRLLAILCRRGDISSADVGAIRIGPTSSTIEVRSDLAEHFGQNAQKPDARDPRVRVRPLPTHWDRELEAERSLPTDKPTRPRRPPASHPAGRPGGGHAPLKKRR